MVSLLALHSLKKKFFKFENVVEFDFTLMNIFMLMKEKYESYSYFCYCDKYKNCCCYPLFKMLFRERLLCSMCRLQSFYFSKNAIDGMCVNEFLDIYVVKIFKNSNSWLRLCGHFLKKFLLRTESVLNSLTMNITGSIRIGTTLTATVHYLLERLLTMINT